VNAASNYVQIRSWPGLAVSLLSDLQLNEILLNFATVRQLLLPRRIESPLYIQ